jgi:hypothetical protein
MCIQTVFCYIQKKKFFIFKLNFQNVKKGREKYYFLHIAHKKHQQHTHHKFNRVFSDIILTIIM